MREREGLLYILHSARMHAGYFCSSKKMKSGPIKREERKSETYL